MSNIQNRLARVKDLIAEKVASKKNPSPKDTIKWQLN